MARKLAGRYEVTGVVPTGVDTWDVTGSFYDDVGLYGPADVAADMRLYLYAALEGVMRYKVLTRTGTTNPITVNVQWDDAGSPIEPPANFGAICDVTNIGSGYYPEEPSYVQQSLDEPLIAGIRSQSNRTQIQIGAGAGEYFQLACYNNTGSVIAANKAVYIKSDGSIALADADLNIGETFGLTKETIDDGVSGNVIYQGRVAGAAAGKGWADGTMVYISQTAGELCKVGDPIPPFPNIIEGDQVEIFGQVAGNDIIVSKQVLTWKE